MQKEKLSEVSEFRAGGLANDGEIDFSQAVKLETGGSICDAFVVRHHRRRVFMKRLKEEYRNSSLHLAALDKEFDVGITLNHKSLPRYLEFHDNYILMDYIEGDSLHKLMVDHDPWHNSEKNLWRFLRQLLEVTDYLHNRHIVHCDIKPDNIILTWEERNVVLIDLDKCFTDWLDDTGGKPRFNKGNDYKEGVATDFEAIGLIIDLWIECVPSLKNKSIIKFRNLCYKKNVRIEELNSFIKKELSNATSKYKSIIGGVIISLFMVAGIIFFQKTVSKRVNEETPEKIAEESPVMVVEDSVVVPHEQDKVNEFAYETDASKGRSGAPAIASLADKSFSRHIEPALKEMKRFRELGKDSTLNQNDLFSQIPDLQKIYFKAFFDTRHELTEAFPEVNIQKIDDAIILSKSFQNYMNEWKETLEVVNKKGVSKLVSDSVNNLD